MGIAKTNNNVSLEIAASYKSLTSARTRIALFDDPEVFFSRPGRPTVKYDYPEYKAVIRTTYLHTSSRLNISPYIEFSHLSADYGTYSESGESGLELTFHNDTRDSTQLVFGTRSSYAFSTSFGAFIPQLDIQWRHEYEGDPRNIAFSFVEDSAAIRFEYQTDALDTDFGQINLGGVFVFAHGIQGFIDVRSLFAHDLYSGTTTSAGIRFEM